MKQHNEFKVYDDCGHYGHGPDDPGVVEVDEVGFVCEDGRRYSICFDCHTHDGDCHEDSPTEQAWPCDARVAMDQVKELEAELAQEKEATVFCPDCRRVVKRTRRLSVHHALQARVKKLEALLEGGQHQGSYNLSRQLGDDVRDALAGEEEIGG